MTSLGPTPTWRRASGDAVPLSNGGMSGGGEATCCHVGRVSNSSLTSASPSGGLPSNGTTISVISSPMGPPADQMMVSTRPPPLPALRRPSHCIHGRPLTSVGASRNGGSESVVPDSTPSEGTRTWWKSWNKKYVLLCCTCGLSSFLLGSFYLAIYFVLRSYTSSLGFFQTVPIYIPACALIVTGILVLCFMRRKNRIPLLIKFVGMLCLICAVVCVVVTVTTTVLHMNRLQTLRECTFYPQLHSCTCLPFTDEESFDLKLDVSITTCDVIHGPLYSCLRAMFGVSVIGILVSIFSCMLVYQLLSHEKKKMYWQQLENRRRLLYRRTPTSGTNLSCNCCDEYGFVPSSEIYPWGVWDPVEDRYWSGGTQVYSPIGGAEDSSTASRSVLLGSNNHGSAPSLWLPWGGTWGATGYQTYQQGSLREVSPAAEAHGTQGETEAAQNNEVRSQTTGVLLRPFLPRGLENRFGLRRQPPPPPGNRRPLSDPGVALQLSHYPPPFSETFIPHLPYDSLEAFSRLMWDPPPPYSQPTSAENLNATSPTFRNRDGHRVFSVLAAPTRRPTTIADIIGVPANSAVNAGIAEGDHIDSITRSPTHFPMAKRTMNGIIGNTCSLPLGHRFSQLPLTHVKSLGDISESNREDFGIVFCDGKEISFNKLPLARDITHRFHSHRDVSQQLLALKAHHLKSVSDPKFIYGKAEQESELYFADVSSCISLRADPDDPLYYSELSSQKNSFPEDNKDETVVGCHLYEQVRHPEQNGREDDNNSHHTSDETMIVHTSSSDRSNGGGDTENTYSILSPLTDQSSASPMVTDTEVYSSYQPMKSPSVMQGICSTSPGNLNLHLHHQRFLAPTAHQLLARHPLVFNDNDRIANGILEEPRYEVVPAGKETSTSSDMNGNVAMTTGQQVEGVIVRQAQRTSLSLPLRKILPVSCSSVEVGEVRSLKEEQPAMVNRWRPDLAKSYKKQFTERGAAPYRTSEPSSSTDQRLQSVQEHLCSLKSVNV